LPMATSQQGARSQKPNNRSEPGARSRSQEPGVKPREKLLAILRPRRQQKELEPGVRRSREPESNRARSQHERNARSHEQEPSSQEKPGASQEQEPRRQESNSLLYQDTGTTQEPPRNHPGATQPPKSY
jgi:hypothetical protein